MLGGNKMKRAGLFFVVMFVLSAAVYAQTITITLSDATSGKVVSGEAGVNTPAWFQPTTPERPWLEAGNYTGQVSRLATKGHDGIIIFGGPNNISSERGIFIHVGNSPSDSGGCVVIAGSQIRKLYSELSKIYGHNGRRFTIRVIDNR
jgi:hypothetical protein